MNFDPPINPNYAATVVRVKNIIPLDNCDNVVGIPVFGYQAIVGKDTQVGDLLVVFPAETQLSEDFTRWNNLYRHSEKNADPTVKGYLEDNRRVRAMKFRGHRSDALAMPLSSLHSFFPDNLYMVGEGDTFDTLNGLEVCRKYVVKTKGPSTQGKSAQEKAFKRVDTKFLPEHYDTDNYFRNADLIAPNEYVYVTQKLHGTSVRIANTIVKRQLKWYERLAQRFGVRVAETEFDHVFGSRKVIKDPNNPNQNHYYDTDLWTREGQKYADLIPQNVVVYGELIGYVNGDSPIQSNYTYNVLREHPVSDPTVGARIMVDSCTCKNQKTLSGARITRNVVRMRAISVDPAMSETYENATQNMPRNGEQINGVLTTVVGTRDIDPQSASTSDVPTNGVCGRLPSTESASKTTNVNRSSVVSAVLHRQKTKPYASITTTPQVLCGDYSVTNAIEESDSWETLRSSYNAHLSTCRIRQDYSWKGNRLVQNAQTHLYVYRVAVVTADGHLYDLSWPAVREFCAERGLNHVPDVWEGWHSDFDPSLYLDTDLRTVVDSDKIVPLSPESPCDEGVVVRVERLAPRMYKAKSPVFLGHETKLLDQEVEDIESAES